MPIGKNAIKRVENNGYSNVKTSAPDMENSNVIANLDPQVMEKMVAPVEQETAAKTAKKAYKENISLKEACVALGFLTAEKFDEVFRPEEMAYPQK